MFAGYGIYVNTAMKPGSFLLEYAGEQISEKEGEKRELWRNDLIYFVLS